jgi:ubiquinone/menaquinone biosynthesis C-methylase UbiE
VTSHYPFQTPNESQEYFEWRNDQYLGYIDLMPVNTTDGLAVLDYGCGPGHDLVGFELFSKPKRLIGIDIAPTSLEEARHRLQLHGISTGIRQLDPGESELPLEPASIDLVHCSGVLHHTPQPDAILREFRRVLRPGGLARVMVYNANSLWMHLYVAYQKMIAEGLYAEMDLAAAFQKQPTARTSPSPSPMTGSVCQVLRTSGFRGALHWRGDLGVRDVAASEAVRRNHGSAATAA